jgi:hypothetical protein
VRRIALLATLVAALAVAPAASANSWLPHPADATWTYEWTNSLYNPTPTKEKVTVREVKGRAFTLTWTTVDQGNPADAPISIGNVAFQETTAGLVNTDWSSTPPPPGFPILCPALAGCNNSLAATYYHLIWGSRAPMLAEPLLQGTRWTSTGGGSGEVASSSDYVGTEEISVPAFPTPVTAAKVRTEISHAGALGDPFGSGVRTVWWVYGVGPVRVVVEHAGGDAPITVSNLVSTNQTPVAAPPDTSYFPLVRGQKLRYRWTNSKHMKRASVQELTVDEVVNGSARFTARHISGPIRVAAAYGFTTRTDGVASLWATSQSASLAKFPPLGPRALPADRRRRFRTPFDLMIYGFNPIIPAYPVAASSWAAKVPSRDFSVFGVRGSTTILGTQRVKVRAGTFTALAVRSRMTQPGFRFGSGTRTSWFAPGKGLVKLVFRHGDGSVSTVELVR